MPFKPYLIAHIHAYIYIVLKIEKNYTFIPTSLFRDCSLIRGFY